MPTELPTGSKVRFRADVMLERPDIAAAMMRVVSLCSEMDYRWAVVLAEILEAEAAAGVAMYNAVDNQIAKGRLLNAAAEKRLEPHYRKDLKALIRKAIDAAKLRNNIAHGQWGGIEGDLDGIVLGDGHWASTAVAGVLARSHGVETILGSIPPDAVLLRFTVGDFLSNADHVAALIEEQIALTKAFKNYRSVIRGMFLSGITEAAERISPA